MSLDDKMEFKYPRLMGFILVASLITSFIGSFTHYEYVKNILLTRINSVPVVEMILYFSYLLFLVIGFSMFRVRYMPLKFLGLIFMGLGMGIVIRIALLFTMVLNPYG